MTADQQQLDLYGSGIGQYEQTAIGVAVLTLGFPVVIAAELVVED